MGKIMATENNLQNGLDAIRADITGLTETVGKLATEAGRVQADMAKTVKRAAKNAAGVGEEMWDEVVDIGEDTVNAARHAAQTGASALGNEIKRNPLLSVLIALGIGLVAAGMLRRK